MRTSIQVTWSSPCPAHSRPSASRRMPWRVPAQYRCTMRCATGQTSRTKAASPVRRWYSHRQCKNSSAASTVLYCGGAPSCGKRLGIRPSCSCAAKVRRMLLASAYRPVESASPGSAIMVSRPQSPKNGYPAKIVMPPVDCRCTKKASAAADSACPSGLFSPAAAACALRRWAWPASTARALGSGASRPNTTAKVCVWPGAAVKTNRPAAAASPVAVRPSGASWR